MGHYVTYIDVMRLLDDEAQGPPDIERVDAMIDEAEARFDNDLRLRFATPFTLAENPDSYEIAQMVTARMAAANYLRQRGARSNDEKAVWYADRLDKAADEWLARLKTPLVPADAPGAGSPYVMVPTDGGGEARESLAFFQRSHVTAGNTKHW